MADVLPSSMKLGASSSVGATSITLGAEAHALAKLARWIAIDPFTSECEVRRVTGHSTTTVTFSGALAYAHATDDAVLYLTQPEYPVEFFGAKGDNSTDDTTSIQRAIDAVAASGYGGVVRFGAATYKITSTLAISSKRGVRLEGDVHSYASPASFQGTTLKWAGTTSLPMLKLWNSQDCAVTWLGFDGADTTGVTGLLLDSDNTVASKRNHLEHLFFRRCEKGIQMASVAGGGTQYQVDSNYITNCAFYEGYGTSTAIYISSQNVDLTRIVNCEISSFTYGVRLVRAGIIQLENVSGGTLTDFIRIEGPYASLQATNCQAESITNWLYVTTGAPDSVAPITLISCTVDAVLNIDKRVRITSVGCTYNANVNLDGDDVEFLSIGDYFNSTSINQNGTNDRAYILAGDKGLNLDGGSAYWKQMLSNTATWNPGSVADGATTNTTITVTGAAEGDLVQVSHSALTSPGVVLFGTVASANTVYVTLINHSGGAYDLASGTLRATVVKHG